MSNKIEKIDSLDRRLIRELDLDSRASFVQLAKRLNVPAETVRYRLNTLLERGVIHSLYSVIDVGQLGCSVHKGLIKLHNVDEVRVEKIIAYLVDHPRINWVVRMDGMFDLSFTLWAYSISDVSAFFDDLKNRFCSYITRIALAVNIEAEFLPRDPMHRRHREGPQKARYTVPKSIYRLDEADLLILRLISSQPRIPATVIAENVGLTSETIAKRIQNLEKHKVISGYRLVLDCNRFGEVNLYVLVYLNLVSQHKIDRFLDYCRAHPFVNYIIKALGEWDYELNVEVQDFPEFRRFMMELTREFAEIVRDYQAMPVSTIHKFMIMPPGSTAFL